MKEPVDNSEFYKRTEYPVRDGIYNWIAKRYGRKGNRWQKSDSFVWGGALYYVYDWFAAIAFIAIIYFFATLTYNRYGIFKGMMVVVSFLLLRISALVRKQDLTNRLLAKIEKK